MFASVTSWFKPSSTKEEGNSSEKSEEKSEKSEEKAEKSDVKSEEHPQETLQQASSNEQTPGEATPEENLQDVALNTAKEFGNFLFSFGKTASEKVVQTATQLKSVIEEKSLIGEFSRQNEKFIEEKRDKSRRQEAAVPPWVGYQDEEILKQQILALALDERNFLRSPPDGVDFPFEMNSFFPSALATLDEDANLKKMRFALVPQRIKEEVFWRNYFYRVSLIRQSSQLTSLTHERNSQIDKDKDESASKKTMKEEEIPAETQHDHEFVSDAFDGNQVNEEELKKDLEQLGMGNDRKEQKSDDLDPDDDWVKELQDELQDELQSTSDGEPNDADLEAEINQMLEDKE